MLGKKSRIACALLTGVSFSGMVCPPCGNLVTSVFSGSGLSAGSCSAPHWFDDPKHSRTRQSVAGMGHRSGNVNHCLSVCGYSRHIRRPHAVDRGSGRLRPGTHTAADGTCGHLPRPLPDTFLQTHRSPCSSVARSVRHRSLVILHVEGLAAVGTAGAIDHLEGPFVQFGSKFVWVEAVIPERQAAEKLVVLVAMRLGVPPPVFNLSCRVPRHFP